MAPSDRVAARQSGIPGKALAILYLIAATAPLLAAWASGIEPASHWFELGAGLAMVSGAMFFLQFWSSGRSRRYLDASASIGPWASIASPRSWRC